jgi:hypothetical protein
MVADHEGGRHQGGLNSFVKLNHTAGIAVAGRNSIGT